MAEILVYNNGFKMAITTKAYDCVIVKELMRGHTLKFAVLNNNPTREYIVPGAIFETQGQQFDIEQFNSESGANNYTDVTALHVSYRLNNYLLPPMFSFLGSVRNVAQAMLEQAVNGDNTPAISEFTLGEVKETSIQPFNLENEQEMTLRAAFLRLQSVGVEVDYDNFIVNLPERVGKITGKVFRFRHDLVSLRRTWNKGDGSTYEIEIATLHKLPGGTPEDEFEVGDNVIVKDDITGEVINRRIVAYAQDPDNPLNDKITLGVFVRDGAANSLNTNVKVSTKITEGEKYNNVYINRTDGFVAESSNGQFKTTQGGEDGFAAWSKSNGVWVKRAWLDKDGLSSSRLADPEKNVYAEMGELAPYTYGMRIVSTDPFYPGEFFKVYRNAFGDGFVMQTQNNNVLLVQNDGKYLTLTADGQDALVASEVMTILKKGTSSVACTGNNATLGAGGYQLLVNSSGISFWNNDNKFGRNETITVTTPTGTRTLTITNGIIL